jgi:Homing endonuclease associated repeat
LRAPEARSTASVRLEPVTPATQRERCPICGRAVPYWTRERIIAAIQRWHREYGYPPKNTDWQPRSTSWHPTISMVRAVFGSWNAALVAAGFPPRYRRWSRAEIKQAIFEWVYTHGRPPTANDWRTADPTRPSESTVRNAFGSWNRGIAAAGYTPRRQGDSRCFSEKLAA